MEQTYILLLLFWGNVEFTWANQVVRCPSMTVDDNVMVFGDLEQLQSGSVVQFSCLSNEHELIGPAQNICGDNGKWRTNTIPKCRPITCTNPPLENFVVLGNKTEYKKDDVLRYNCNRGYKKSDGRPSLCLKFGQSAKWAPEARCKPKTCKVSSKTPTGTSYSPQKTIFNVDETVMVSCADNLWVKNKTLVSTELTCLETEEWNFHPVCQLVTCDKYAENVSWWEGAKWDPRTESNRDTVYIDETVEYRCRGGFEETNPSRRATCTRQGWDPNPLCTAITCTNPPLENFVVLGDKTEYKKDDVLRYKCNRGYKKSDGRPSLCLKFGQSAKWSPEPRCELITCEVSSKPPMGTIYSPRQTHFNVDENVTVSCADKQWVKNKGLISAELTCLETGEWDSHPVCQLVTCDKYDQNVFWWERAKWDPRSQSYRNAVYIDETVEYRCRRGFEETNPSRRATCTRQGWDPNPLCTDTSCGKPSYRNAQVHYQPEKNKYRHGDWAYLECTYDPRVQFHVQCLLGQWEGSPKSCREKPCTTEPNIEHAVRLDYERRVYEHGETLSFRCDGETDILQQICESGEWRAQRSCQAS